MCALTSCSQLQYFAGVGCDEGGGCNEVVMEVAMEVVMIKGDQDKTLFITYYTLLHILFFSYNCTADECTGISHKVPANRNALDNNAIIWVARYTIV